MRYVKIGRWSSAVDDWTLCECKLSAPQYRRSVVTVPGRDGVLDLSDVLTGEVHYDMRKLTIRLENSSGSRENRMGWISFMVNSLDGTEQEIELPDDHDRVLRGRVRVAAQRPSMPASTFLPSTPSSSLAAASLNMQTRSTLYLRTISATFSTLLFAATA